jgi:hypothetical protein
VGEGEQLRDPVVVEAEDLENLLLVEPDTTFEDLLPGGGERVGRRPCRFGGCGHWCLHSIVFRPSLPYRTDTGARCRSRARAIL